MNDSRVIGKEYYKNGKLKFEGEYLFEDKIKGKVYDYYGNVVFKLNNNNGIIEEKNDILRIYTDSNQEKEKKKGKE